MFEPEELHWGIKALFEFHEPMEYPPRLAFSPLAPEVKVEDFAREVVWCRARFDSLARQNERVLPRTAIKKHARRVRIDRRVRTRVEYMREWNRAHSEQNATRARASRAAKGAKTADEWYSESCAEARRDAIKRGWEERRKKRRAA